MYFSWFIPKTHSGYLSTFSTFPHSISKQVDRVNQVIKISVLHGKAVVAVNTLLPCTPALLYSFFSAALLTTKSWVGGSIPRVCPASEARYLDIVFGRKNPSAVLQPRL